MDPNLYAVGEPEVLRTVMVRSPGWGKWEGKGEPKAPAVIAPRGAMKIFRFLLTGPAA